MGELPTGTVTFLFSDIEGSTVRWERHPAAMTAALSQHNAIMRSAIDRHNGVLYETAGDSFVIAFASALDALEAALSAQRALLAETWPADTGALRVRMAVHTGTAEMRDDGYYAQHTLSRQARLLDAGHGGQILVSGPTSDALTGEMPDGVELSDMGVLVLKDLIDPEHVFQVIADGPPWSLPTEFPPLRSERAQIGNAPQQSVEFVGRQPEIAEIVSVLADDRVRVLTLTGPGGIGKTRLALRAAERMFHRFTDGVHFVDVAATTDPAMVVPLIASVLGVGEDDERPFAATLGAHLAEQRLLLVLDNLEQVVGVGPAIEALLVAAPSLQILATSRVAVQVEGEALFAVSPLGLPGRRDVADVEALGSVDSVALFVERARSAKRGFALTSDNAEAVAAICHRVEGIPLALVLAAARSEVLAPKAMLERLDDRLAVLKRGTKDLPPRQQALRNTIEWSYELLEGDEQRLYAAASVFVGGFRLDAAEAVGVAVGADALDVLDGVSALVDNSLVTSAETFDDDRRFRMLEMIAQHAGEKLDASGELEVLRQRHAEHFFELAERAAPHLEGEQMVEWFTRLEEDLDNIRAALSWSFERGEAGDVGAARLAVRLSAALALFWYDHGYLSEGVSNLGRAAALVPTWLAAADGDDDRRHALRSLGAIQYDLGGISNRRGHFDIAESSMRESLKIAQETADVRAQGRSWTGLGTVFFTQRDLEEAHRCYTRGLPFSEDAGDRFNLINLHISLGNIERDAGRSELARPHYEHAAATAEEIGDHIGKSVALNNFANMSIDVGELERALELHRQSLKIRDLVGHRLMTSESIVGIAAVDSLAGRPETAAQLIGCAEALAEAVGGRFDPTEQKVFDRTIALLEQTLGTQRTAELRNNGRQVEYAAAVALALDVNSG